MNPVIDTIDHGEVRELRLARPPVNALDPGLCDALRDAVARSADDGVAGLVLSGGPGVFSAGLDVPYLLSLEGRAPLESAWTSFFDAARALAGAPMPVVAAIGGHAPAGGCVLALCCDYRVMALGPYRIGLNESQVGLPVPEGAQHLMRRVIGNYPAERLLVAGEMVDAERALALGLVDELTDIDHVVTRARAWLEQLLTLPRRPVLRTRAIARADLVAALHPDRLRLGELLDAWEEPDTQAGLRAMLARIGK